MSLRTLCPVMSYRSFINTVQLMSVHSTATQLMSRHAEGVNPSLSSTVQRPRHAEFVSESARLKSFERGRVGAGQSASALARAGFLYFSTILNSLFSISINQSINQSNLAFVKRRLNKVLRGASYE